MEFSIFVPVLTGCFLVGVVVGIAGAVIDDWWFRKHRKTYARPGISPFVLGPSDTSPSAGSGAVRNSGREKYNKINSFRNQ